jgi:hypothetical protein
MKLNLVPPRIGIQWVKLGIQTFWRQPVALCGLFFLYMAAAVLLSSLPLVGPVLMLTITPAATLGLMVATQEAATGKFPMPTVLVAAMRAGRQRLRSMAQLGLIYAIGSLLILGIATLLVGRDPAAAAAATSAAVGTAATPPQMDATSLVLLALHLPLAIAFWFAPALVHWHGVTPVKSLFFSVVAVVRNFGAFVVFGLIWAVVVAALAFAMSTVVILLGSPQMAPALMMPIALLVAAMFFTSIYFTFIDCFTVDPEPPPPQPAQPPHDPTHP